GGCTCPAAPVGGAGRAGDQRGGDTGAYPAQAMARSARRRRNGGRCADRAYHRRTPRPALAARRPRGVDPRMTRINESTDGTEGTDNQDAAQYIRGIHDLILTCPG